MRTISAIATLLIACGPPKSGAGGGGGGGGDDMPAPDGNNGGGDIDADTTPVDSSSCGAQMSNIGVVNLGDPPDLLVVLDRSGSMSSPPSTFPPVFTSKWQTMKTSLTGVVNAKQQQIKFGLLEFPSDDNPGCSAVATPKVNIGLGAGPGFTGYFGSRSPGGNTPAHVGLTSALTYFNSIPVNTAGRYVLFATDGLPNCLNADPNTASEAATVAAVTALKNAGIKTFVLGFGGGFGTTPQVLNDAAVAGGLPKPGATKFYEATSQAELDQALAAIAGGIIVPSCSFALATAPPDPNAVTVTINGTPVPRSPSHGNGWDYSPNAMTITFFGTYCSSIMQGAMSNVSFVYGCPGPVIN
jgi:hypothetical protein